MSRVCHAYPDELGEAYIGFHVIFRFVIYFSLPICTIAIFYALMARMLIVSTKHMPGEAAADGHAAKQVSSQ